MPTYRRFLVLGLIVSVVATAAACRPHTMAARPAPDVVAATGGDITIAPIAHGTVQVEQGGHVVLLDPTTNAGFDGVSGTLRINYSQLKAPTIVLVTDEHGDHYDHALLQSLRTAAGARPAIVGPDVVASHVDGAVAIANGESRIVDGVAIEAVAMYNTIGQEPFHTKGRGNGYIVTLGGKRLYFAGDTACTAEMRALKGIDVAFLPMNLPYTMTPSDAAICAVAFKPAVAYPYHYRGQDPNRFALTLAGTGIDVRLRDWYAGTEPFTNSKF
jgi:L-ascorbate metabolism protein UlaG (beta-lactamase superfamily)